MGGGGPDSTRGNLQVDVRGEALQDESHGCSGCPFCRNAFSSHSKACCSLRDVRSQGLVPERTFGLAAGTKIRKLELQVPAFASPDASEISLLGGGFCGEALAVTVWGQEVYKGEDVHSD